MLFEDSDPLPFIDTRDDKLSTFAIDVDTGAYTLMRRYLADHGSVPPPESVRVEEYINYFDYNYPPPESEAFAIHIDGAPTPYGESDAYHLVRIGIQGYTLSQSERPDVLLIFVIDVSGSMARENRLGLVKESLRLLVAALRPTDRVGIVAYGANAYTVLEPTPVESGERIMDAVASLRTGGSTNVDGGIHIAYQMANRYRLDGQQARLIVLSDGVANVGNTTAEEILENARRGVSLSTFGFGMGNYNDALMEQLANQGDGAYAYIDTLREAQRLFVTDMTRTIHTIAKDAKIQVEFSPDVVERYRLIGYENREIADDDFRDDTVDAGEIGAGHSVTALYEIRLADDAPQDATALTVRVRYEVPQSADTLADSTRPGDIVELSQSVTPSAFADTLEESDAGLQLAAVVAEFAELLSDSYWARDNELDLVWQDVERVGRNFRGSLQVLEFVDLVEAAAAYDR